jgi:hypothetical protein
MTFMPGLELPNAAVTHLLSTFRVPHSYRKQTNDIMGYNETQKRPTRAHGHIIATPENVCGATMTAKCGFLGTVRDFVVDTFPFVRLLYRDGTFS